MQSSLYRYYFVSAVIFYKNMESNMNKDTYMYIHYTICIKIYNFFYVFNIFSVSSSCDSFVFNLNETNSRLSTGRPSLFRSGQAAREQTNNRLETNNFCLPVVTRSCSKVHNKIVFFHGGALIYQVLLLAKPHLCLTLSIHQYVYPFVCFNNYHSLEQF